MQYMGEDPSTIGIPNYTVQQYLAEKTLKLWRNEGLLISSTTFPIFLLLYSFWLTELGLRVLNSQQN